MTGDFAIGQRVVVKLADSAWYGQKGAIVDAMPKTIDGHEIQMYRVRLDNGREIGCRHWALAAEEAAI